MPKPPSSAASYPTTLYPPPVYPNLASLEDRERLSPAALRGFLRIMQHWRVRDEEARRLLNGVSNGTFYQWKQGSSRTLDQDRLMRISYLVGIFKSLNILFSAALADRWIQLPNSNAIFAGRTPLAYMLSGGTASHAHGAPAARCAARRLTAGLQNITQQRREQARMFRGARRVRSDTN